MYVITIQSFSYRAPPQEVADGFVFDCRMLVNPGREEIYLAELVHRAEMEVQYFPTLRIANIGNINSAKT